jgi:hypothetical protein
VTTTSPFTRYSSKKHSADIDENKLDKLPSTTSRGKYRENGYQVRNLYYTFSSTVFSGEWVNKVQLTLILIIKMVKMSHT